MREKRLVPLEDSLLSLLLGRQEPTSGEELSVRLGVTRAAVWKSITALREQGYTIESATNRGYRIAGCPNRLTHPLVAAHLQLASPQTLVCLESVDSTILHANRLLLDGCADGTVVVADQQTAGVGRMGRSFLSDAGVGIYLSMIIEPRCTADELGLLTSYAGLAVCGAIEQLCGVSPTIKWPNDIMLGNRKVCGILTRLVTDAESGTITHAIIGIGINVLQRSFPDELADKAVSLWQATGNEHPRAQLAAAVIDRLEQMLRVEHWLASAPTAALVELRQRSATIGRAVQVVTPTTSRTGIAVDIDTSGELLVRFGEVVERVTAGEVSVRGLLGYNE